MNAPCDLDLIERNAKAAGRWHGPLDAVVEECRALRAAVRERDGKMGVAVYVAQKAREIAGVETGSVLDVVDGLAKERDILKKERSAMHRRAQKAEGEVAEFHWFIGHKSFKSAPGYEALDVAKVVLDELHARRLLMDKEHAPECATRKRGGCDCGLFEEGQAAWDKLREIGAIPPLKSSSET